MRQVDLTKAAGGSRDPARVARLTRHLKARLEDFGPGGPQVGSPGEGTGAGAARFPRPGTPPGPPRRRAPHPKPPMPE